MPFIASCGREAVAMTWMHGVIVGIAAFGTQWPMIDLPYPEVPDGGGAVAPVLAPAPTPEQQVEAAIVRHAPTAPPGRRVDIAQLRIDGTRATALVTTGAHIEWVHLELCAGEWKVVQTFAHR
jgi:hypothetical protein